MYMCVCSRWNMYEMMDNEEIMKEEGKYTDKMT
jgi:hypothetical protein